MGVKGRESVGTEDEATLGSSAPDGDTGNSECRRGAGESKRRSPDLACFSIVPLGARIDSHMAGYGDKDLVREVKNAGKRGHY